jgi:hypothetical protein
MVPPWPGAASCGVLKAFVHPQADAASASAVAAGQDASSVLSRNSESAMLRGLASTRGAAAARKLLQLDNAEIKDLIEALDKLLIENGEPAIAMPVAKPNDDPPDPYRRSLLGLRSN